MMQVYLEPKGKLVSTAHIVGTKEYIIVFDEELTIYLEGEEYRILPNQAFQFNADKDHIYENKTNKIVSLCMLVYYF